MAKCPRCGSKNVEFKPVFGGGFDSDYFCKKCGHFFGLRKKSLEVKMSRVSDFEKTMNKKYKYNQLCKDCGRRLRTNAIKIKCPFCGSRRMGRKKSGME